MKIPEDLQEAIDRLALKASPQILRKARETLTRTYKEGRSSRSIFSDEALRLCYLATRFPATYAACHRVFCEIKKRLPSFFCKKIVDLGAGPGTATWAARDVFAELETAVLFEKSCDAIALGQNLQRECLDFFEPGAPSGGPSMKWICGDLEALAELERPDLAVVSYALGELNAPEKLLDRIWEQNYPLVAFIEPGTPTGFQLIRTVRHRLIAQGAQIVAPCPHAFVCPMQESDWCHFSARVERAKLHRMLKEATLSYEDEKFSYLVVARGALCGDRVARIVRHPQKGSGHVRLSLCTSEGKLEEKIVSRKNKEIYRVARDAEWGDSLF